MTRTSILIVCESPTRSNLALLNHAQQLGLQRRTHRRDFIEEQCSLVCLLEPALPRCDRAGEGAGTWPKSSPSRSVSGIALQLMASNSLLASRALLDGPLWPRAPCRSRSHR